MRLIIICTSYGYCKDFRDNAGKERGRASGVSADDSHAVLVFQCKRGAKPERLAPYPNSSPHHDLKMNRGTALKSV